MSYRHLALGALLLIQSPVRIAKVSGLVTDNVGGWLRQVTVIFRAEKFEKKIVSGDGGHYQLDLPAGKYEVRARFHGCKDFRLKEWTAQRDIPNTLNISLYCPPTPIY
jgi:hypothetical protein